MTNNDEVTSRLDTLKERARKAGFISVIAAVFLLMILTVVVREVLSTAFSGAEEPQLTPVVSAEVMTLHFADTLTAVGTARANESVAVTSKISDIVSRVGFDSGDVVSGGQVLAELVDAEEAAGLESARATLDEARRERTRVSALKDRGVVPLQNFDEAVSNYQRAAAEVSAIEARMDNHIIRAPFDGVVGLQNISVGELIDAGTVIARLNDVSLIKLDFSIPERGLSSIAIGQRVQARSSAWPDEIFYGVIKNIDNEVDAISRTVTVRAEIPNPDGRLMPGMLLRVEVRRNEREQLGIPEAALMRMADQAYVFVLDDPEEDSGADAVIRHQTIQPGLRYAGYVEVLEGLQAGERVVADGTHRVRDESAVRITGERDEPPAVLLSPSPDPLSTPASEQATDSPATDFPAELLMPLSVPLSIPASDDAIIDAPASESSASEPLLLDAVSPITTSSATAESADDTDRSIAETETISIEDPAGELP